MSAVALVPQDTAGLSGLVARKASPGAQNDDPDADFSAALAQTAEASPSPATAAATPRAKGGDDIWRTLAAFSDEAKAPQCAAGDLPGDATAEAVSAPALKPSLMASEVFATHEARFPAKPNLRATAASVTPSRAESPNAERLSGAPDKTAAKAAPQAEAAANSTACPSNPPAWAVLAAVLPPTPPEDSDSAASGPSTDPDAVARIGAALATQGADGTQRPATSDPGLKDAKFSEEASEGKTLSVHVVAQQAWLQPVSPVFSPGLRRQAAADRAALETPQAAGKIENTARGNVEVTDKDAPPAVATKFPGPSANPAPEKTPPSSSAPCSPSGGNFASDRSEPPKPAAAVAPPSDEPRPNLAAAPKKNLEITLAPKELGGLEVRMKSAGDRLELGFVADRGETARLISDRSATLTSQLQGAGIGLGGIDISSAAAGQGASGDAPTGGDRDSNPAPQRQHTSGRDRQDGNNEIDDQTGDAPSRGRRGFYL